MYVCLELTIRDRPVRILIDRPRFRDTRPICFIVGLANHYADKLPQEFKDSYRVVLVDLYWSNPSFLTKSEISRFTLGDFAADINSVRNQMVEQFGNAFNKVFILGHSSYGFLGIKYALLYPEHVHGIINVCMPPHFKDAVLREAQEKYMTQNYLGMQRWREFSQHMQKSSPSNSDPTTRSPQENASLALTFLGHTDSPRVVRYYERQLEVPHLTPATFSDWYAQMSPLLWLNPENWDTLFMNNLLWQSWVVPSSTKHDRQQAIHCEVNTDLLYRYITLIQAYDPMADLDRLALPVLWVVGIHDSRVSLGLIEDACFTKDARPINKLKSNVQLSYSESGHWPMIENPAEFGQIVDEWKQAKFGYLLPQNLLTAALRPICHSVSCKNEHDKNEGHLHRSQSFIM